MNKLLSYLLLFLLAFALTNASALEKPEAIGELNTELLLLSENTSGLPNNRDDLERTRLSIWSDLEAPINDNFSFGVSIYANAGTDDADDNRRNLDNARSNTFEFNQYFLDWNPIESSFLRIGKQLMPIKISSMLWDKKIALDGISLVSHWSDDEDNQYSFATGRHSVDHIFSEQVELIFVDFHFEMPVASAFLSTGISMLYSDNTDHLITDNLVRTNTSAALLEGFKIALFDINLDFTWLSQPALFSVEILENTSLETNNQAYRLNFIFGDNGREAGWQFNLHYQDIERDASIAAFVDDDWWFATWMNGYRVSASYGLTDDTFVQVSYFDEELQMVNTKRVFLEIRSFF